MDAGSDPLDGGEAEGDMVDAIKGALERRGSLNSIRAQLRAEVFHALEDKTVEIPEKPRDVYLASEIIREFLGTLKLANTASVFNEEIGQPSEMRVDRDFIGAELGFDTTETDKQVPLLVMLVQQLRRNKERLEMDLHSSLDVDVSGT
jgi:lisH domain-containing protein FOPNL